MPAHSTPLSAEERLWKPAEIATLASVRRSEPLSRLICGFLGQMLLSAANERSGDSTALLTPGIITPRITIANWAHATHRCGQLVRKKKPLPWVRI
ncbi:MAG: hypothetical protein V3U76_00015 [Granulosicoccus sp.]